MVLDTVIQNLDRGESKTHLITKPVSPLVGVIGSPQGFDRFHVSIETDGFLLISYLAIKSMNHFVSNMMNTLE